MKAKAMKLPRTLLFLLCVLLAAAATAGDRRIVGNDDAGLAALVAERRAAWTLREVEFEKIGSGDLELREIEVFATGSRVIASDGLGEMTVARPATRFLRGTVNGVAGSVVALTVPADGEVTGLATDGNLVWTLRRRLADRRLEAVAVDAARDGPRKPFQCGLDRLPQPQSKSAHSAVPEVPAVAAAIPAGQLYQATIAIETD